MAKNAEDTIKECLENLSYFSEVILYLNNSTDKTLHIAKLFKNVVIIDGDFIGFGPTKNKAATYAKNSWILSLDSDEILNESLVKEIAEQDYTDESKIFILNRNNFFLGADTTSKDSIARIYSTKHTLFNNNNVHEKVIIKNDSKKIVLKQSFKHYNIININQTLTKMIHYTDLGSQDKKMCFFSIVILKAIFTFFKNYFLKLRILNGWRGFVIAITHANRSFYKYLKQFINCREEK